MLTFIRVRQQRRVRVAAMLQVSGDPMDGTHHILVYVGAGGLCRPNALVIPVPLARRGGRRSSPIMWRSRGEEGLIPVPFPPSLPAGSHREPRGESSFRLAALDRPPPAVRLHQGLDQRVVPLGLWCRRRRPVRHDDQLPPTTWRPSATPRSGTRRPSSSLSDHWRSDASSWDRVTPWSPPVSTTWRGSINPRATTKRPNP